MFSTGDEIEASGSIWKCVISSACSTVDCRDAQAFRDQPYLVLSLRAKGSLGSDTARSDSFFSWPLDSTSTTELSFVSRPSEDGGTTRYREGCLKGPRRELTDKQHTRGPWQLFGN